MLFRMALTACALGTVTGVMGTGRVTLSLVASGTLMWSFVPILQLLTGIVFISGPNATALRAYFATGRPWLFWYLALGMVFLFWPDPGLMMLPLVLTAVIPVALTVRALRKLAPWRAVMLHQAATLALMVTYIAWAIGGWIRLYDEVFGR